MREKQDGIKEKANEMVINMYNNGITLDVIIKSANLSIDEVNEIIKKE